MILYKTIEKPGEAEQMIEKSRFIAYAKPVETKEEADAFIEEIRSMHKSATHHVPAMVIGDKFQIQWASDDGEPQGTSGAPMVQMLVKEGITNAVVVVTRYFGGIKLGTGGLVRAYTSSAKLGLEAAGLCHVEEMAVLYIKTDYSCLSKIQNMAQNGVYQIGDITYEDMVTLKIQTAVEKAEEVKKIFANVTAGTAVILNEERELSKIPVSQSDLIE